MSITNQNRKVYSIEPTMTYWWLLGFLGLSYGFQVVPGTSLLQRSHVLPSPLNHESARLCINSEVKELPKLSISDSDSQFELYLSPSTSNEASLSVPMDGNATKQLRESEVLFHYLLNSNTALTPTEFVNALWKLVKCRPFESKFYNESLNLSRVSPLIEHYVPICNATELQKLIHSVTTLLFQNASTVYEFVDFAQFHRNVINAAIIHFNNSLSDFNTNRHSISQLLWSLSSFQDRNINFSNASPYLNLFKTMIMKYLAESSSLNPKEVCVCV